MVFDTWKPTIIFIIDTSGSMFGQKIEAVNAAIAEGIEILRNKSGSDFLQIGYVTFDEKWGDLTIKEDIEIIDFKIKPNADGFYKLTSFQCLYEGITRCLSAFNQPQCKLCLFLITDGKPVDSGDYTEALERVKNMDAFRNAERYVVLVGNDLNGMDNEILEFVRYKADKIVKVNEVANALLKALISLRLNIDENSVDAIRYKKIFGD